MKGDDLLLGENATIKVLEWFSRNPSKKVFVNELSRTIPLSNASCSRILNRLVRKDLLIKEELGRAHYYQLKDHYATREMKRFFMLLRLHESKLIEELPESDPTLSNLVLYGSCATGTFDEKSDMDILSISNGDKTVNIEPYQQFLGMNIEITSMNIGRWVLMKKANDGFYQEVKRTGILLWGSELP